MNIYTKTGDKGTTSLATGERVSKTDLRLEAYGTADELNSYIGLLRAKLADMSDMDAYLTHVQNLLFNLGARLAGADLVIKASEVERIEREIDLMQAHLTPLHVFILPAGNERVALCHVCRTVTRRLERQMVALSEQNVIISASFIAEFQFVNRLSDYLFVLARFVGEKDEVSVTIWNKD
ncbi:MAG: cob(I)yrinic acid a,c-diamide adenosyltransferase [Paludibacteraceae bacterium]|nr:cob(I)yrinic acid a,c-diamide adenosyltransferase [Paludibacteraceae bacterium]